MILSTSQEHAVKRYYDRNTSRFIRFGKDAGTQNFHRAVWAEGVSNLFEAMNYQNRRLLAELEELGHAAGPDSDGVRVLDLGCGVGGSLFYLAEQHKRPASFVGLSISPKQVAIAGRRSLELGLSDRCSFVERDFHSLHGLPVFTLAYAIEAFVHSSAPERFFGEVARQLAPGGRLVLCDDFLTERGALARGSEARCIDTFKAGWLAPAVMQPRNVEALAAAHDLRLIKDDDLTGTLHLGRPRDKAVALLVRAIGPLAYTSNYLRMLKGGDALQTALRRGLISYRFLVFEKRSAQASGAI